MSDTIFALATGSGRAAVAIVRISGHRTASILTALAGRMPRPRHAALTHLHDPFDNGELDHALVLWFPAPGSFTGEDCAELHLHGGRAVTEAVLGCLGRFPDCRLASPGEFTRRAFLNGKMDLAAAEGLSDLIDAQTEAQRRQALRQLDGALGTWVGEQRRTLLQALAAAESAIDFADEGDVTGAFDREIQDGLVRMAAAVEQELRLGTKSARVRDGLVVTLAGPPNAGKSTLLNALARRDAAIVSPHAGTTRDPVEVQLDLDGHLVLCIDTAGIRATDEPIEREGVARARARAAQSDLVLWLQDAREIMAPDAGLSAPVLWTVATKVDLVDARPENTDFAIAAPSGAGVPALIAAISAHAGRDEAGHAGIVTRLRHRQALERVALLLREILEDSRPQGMEIVAEQLRQVVVILDSLVGGIETEEVLGEIFSRFCVGK